MTQQHHINDVNKSIKNYTALTDCISEVFQEIAIR